MASKSKRAQMAPQRNLAKTFMYWAIAILVVKLVIIFNIQALPLNETWGKDFLVGGIWPGSDAENYLAGYINLITNTVIAQYIKVFARLRCGAIRARLDLLAIDKPFIKI